MNERVVYQNLLNNPNITIKEIEKRIDEMTTIIEQMTTIKNGAQDKLLNLRVKQLEQTKPERVEQIFKAFATCKVEDYQNCEIFYFRTFYEDDEIMQTLIKRLDIKSPVLKKHVGFLFRNLKIKFNATFTIHSRETQQHVLNKLIGANDYFATTSIPTTNDQAGTIGQRASARCLLYRNNEFTYREYRPCVKTIVKAMFDAGKIPVCNDVFGIILQFIKFHE